MIVKSTSLSSNAASRFPAEPSSSGSFPSRSGAARSAAGITPKVEERFRLWAFHILYRRTYRDETDLLLRFVKALTASAQPIADPAMLETWRRIYGGLSEKQIYEKALTAPDPFTVVGDAAS